jgi:hypothetical protein
MKDGSEPYACHLPYDERLLVSTTTRRVDDIQDENASFATRGSVFMQLHGVNRSATRIVMRCTYCQASHLDDVGLVPSI